MSHEAAETSPLLSTIEPNIEEKLQQEIANKRETIALNIVDRCINNETNQLFTKQEIINAIINNNINIDINKPIYDSASEIINILASSGNLSIVHKEDPDLLSILNDQSQSIKPTVNNNNNNTNNTNNKMEEEKENKYNDNDEESISSSSHSTHSHSSRSSRSHSTKKSRRNKQQRIEDMKLKIAKHISIHCINQDTNERYSYQYILNEINDLEFNIRLDRSVEQQGMY